MRLAGDWTKDFKKKITSKNIFINSSEGFSTMNEGWMIPTFDRISVDG